MTRRFATLTTLCLAVAIIACIVIVVWRINSDLKAELEALDTGTQVSAVVSEGSDETLRTTDVLAEYVTPSNHPRALYIEKLAIAARVLPMTINDDSSVQTPRNIFDAGWYTSSAKPGTSGTTLIDGHASGATKEGLFAELHLLQEGDEIVIENGNGDRISYAVRLVEVVGPDAVDTSSLLSPSGGAKKSLTIMTSVGKFTDATATYGKRTMVFAEQAS